jgi:hypothetical protein
VGQRRQTWFDTLPEEVRDDLVEIRAEFQAGGTGVTAMSLSRAILADLQSSRGIKPCSLDTLRLWISGK